MTLEQLVQYAPKAVAILISLGLLHLLLKYKRNNDPAAWLRKIYASMTKGEKDEEYRQTELADANAEIAKTPKPENLAPLTNKQHVRIAAFPKLMFMAGLTGIVFVYMGLFETMPEGVTWPIFAGGVFLVLAGVLYWMSEKGRPQFRRAQQLNRKYLLQKAGKDAERFDTMKELLEYYPSVPELWMELGEQYGADERYGEAVDAVRKAREIAPEKINFAIVELSFLVRKKDPEGMTKTLAEAEKLETSPSDPRVAIYKGAQALLRNEKKVAGRYGKEAMELDANFTEQLVKKDEGLQDLAELWAEIFEKKEAELLAEVAKRQKKRREAAGETTN